MDSRKIALCGYLAVLCIFSNAQSAKQKKDVLIFEDSCYIKSDTSRRLSFIIDTIQGTGSSTEIGGIQFNAPASSHKDSTITVTRGYSPFTNYTDTFNIAQSPPTKESDEPLSPKKTKTQRFYTSSDTIHDQFIHEYNFSYSKTEMAAVWNQYMNESVTQNHRTAIEVNIDEPRQVATIKTEKQTQDVNNTEFAANSKPSANPTLASHSVNKPDKNINTENTMAVEYYIQLAASRKALNPDEINRLTAQNEQVRTIEEEQWFKYQIPIGGDYIKARASINNYPHKNVFLVAYKGMHRLDLWETVKQIELQKPKNQELMFVIQLAASRTPLSREQVSQLHDGHEHVREIEEEGWHKYQIVIGSSYNLTIEKWKMIGVSKSFPVAYLNNQKIEMSEALKITRINK